MPESAMVLAAGFGERLRPLTEIKPKPLLPVCNRPVIEGVLALLRRCGVNRVVINLHHKGEDIEAELGDGRRLGLDISYSYEETILGTAGGIKAAEEHLKRGPFFVINSDILLDADLEALSRFHRRKGAEATLLLREEEARRYGAIGLDGEGRVVRFLRITSETGGSPLMTAMFTGVQLLEPSVLKRIPPEKRWGTAEDLYPELLKEGVFVYGLISRGKWIDMGTPGRYLQANFMVLRNPLLMGLDANDLSATGINGCGKGEAHKGVKLWPPVMLGEGCKLGRGSVIGPNVVLGSGCEVGRGSRIVNSVLWKDVSVGIGALLEESIVAERVRVPGCIKIKRAMVAAAEDESLSITYF